MKFSLILLSLISLGFSQKFTSESRQVCTYDGYPFSCEEDNEDERFSFDAEPGWVVHNYMVIDGEAEDLYKVVSRRVKDYDKDGSQDTIYTVVSAAQIEYDVVINNRTSTLTIECEKINLLRILKGKFE